MKHLIIILLLMTAANVCWSQLPGPRHFTAEVNDPTDGVGIITNAAEGGFAGLYFQSGVDNNANLQGWLGYVGNGAWDDTSTFQLGSFIKPIHFLFKGRAMTIDSNDIVISRMLHVEPNHTVLFGADTLGAGKKLMWIPSKAAFRAGEAFADRWEPAKIGDWSVAFGNGTASGVQSVAFGSSTLASANQTTAFGFETKATANGATAWGVRTTASKFSSTAWGESTIASNNNATAWGEEAVASGDRSTAWGWKTRASGTLSTAWGESSVASNFFSTAWGLSNHASGQRATAWGQSNLASGHRSTTWGIGNIAQSIDETVIGSYADTIAGADPSNSVPTDQLFAVGNGTADAARSNALTVYKNGNTRVGGALILDPGEIAVTTGSLTLDVSKTSFARVRNLLSNNPTDVSLGDGSYVGQVLVVTLIDEPRIRISNNDNTKLQADREVNISDTLQLIWDGQNWLELSFSEN